MNVIGYAPPSFSRPPRRRLRRVDTVTLASSVSILTLLAATGLYVFAGVGETPLVVGTILVASIAGWVNAYLPVATAAPDDGGDDITDDYDLDQDWYEQAA